ncbi:MAG: hypothetical protein U1G07_15940 [Verrucomicrobiota bacterium]
MNNDGPTFNAVFFELSSGSFGSDQVQRVPLELPTNTRKRFVIPVFAAGNRTYQWDARLIDERGSPALREGLQENLALGRLSPGDSPDLWRARFVRVGRPRVWSN